MGLLFAAAFHDHQFRDQFIAICLELLQFFLDVALFLGVGLFDILLDITNQGIGVIDEFRFCASFGTIVPSFIVLPYLVAMVSIFVMVDVLTS